MGDLMEPLAIKLRPKKLDDVIGQSHLIGKDKVLTNLVKNKKLFSMILYGKPGIGKTTIATAITEELGLKYRKLNAVINNNSSKIEKNLFIIHSPSYYVIFIIQYYFLFFNVTKVELK